MKHIRIITAKRIATLFIFGRNANDIAIVCFLHKNVAIAIAILFALLVT